MPSNRKIAASVLALAAVGSATAFFVARRRAVARKLAPAAPEKLVFPQRLSRKTRKELRAKARAKPSQAA